MSIDAAFFGFLAADAERRTSRAGKPWTRLRVGVGKDDAVQWVQVAVFGAAADVAGKLKKQDRIYIEGTLRLDTWTDGKGAERHGLSVAAFKCEQTHRIGRNRPKRQATRQSAAASPDAPESRSAPDSGLDDEIPF